MKRLAIKIFGPILDPEEGFRPEPPPARFLIMSWEEKHETPCEHPHLHHYRSDGRQVRRPS